MKLVKKLFLKLLPLCFWLMVMLSFGDISICILTITSAAYHEFGHIAAYYILKKEKLSSPRAVLNGLKLYTGATLSYFEELIITLCGPLANLLIFAISLPFFHLSDYIYSFGIINLLCALSNLFPIKGYDGYGILNAILSHRFGLASANILDFISLIFSAALVLFFLVTIFIIGEGYWIFAVFFIHLLKEILKSHS